MSNEKGIPKNKAVNATGKLIAERMKVLEADPEFIKLRRSIPEVIKGKESGKDFHVITRYHDLYKGNKDNSMLLLSKSEWDAYKKFERLGQKLSQKYKLHWATVEDMALGLKHPAIPPRFSRSIKANLDPIVLLPKPFDPNKKYVADFTIVPPLAAIEIMSRIQGLEQKMQEEIKNYLLLLFQDTEGCRCVELRESTTSQDNKIEFDVCMKIPIGYTAREVAEMYLKVDDRRRQILAALGMPVGKRRRQSKNLMDAKSLKLHKNNINIYEILDHKYPNYELESSQDQQREKTIINRRYQGRRLLRKRLQQ